MKALIIVDVCTVQEFLENESIKDTLSRLGDDVEVEVIQDEFMPQFASPLEYIGRVEKEGPEWVPVSDHLLKKLADVEILLVHWAAVNSKMIDAGKKLKFIGAMRSGFEHINVEYAQSKGITVRNCPGRLANSVADLTLALILSENKGLLRRNLRATKGKFVSQDKYYDAGNRPLCMQKVGLVGFGIIAQAVAQRLKACGSTVIAYDPFCPDNVFEEQGVMRVQMDKLLAESDIVSMHVRLSEETRHMFGRKEFPKMKPTAIFINTARAGLVDEDALIDALREGEIRGAGLDVFSKEPIEEGHPFLTMDNVTATPHCGGVFYGMFELSVSMMIDILTKYLRGEPV